MLHDNRFLFAVRSKTLRVVDLYSVGFVNDLEGNCRGLLVLSRNMSSGAIEKS
jgi:hypothetical protein